MLLVLSPLCKQKVTININANQPGGYTSEKNTNSTVQNRTVLCNMSPKMDQPALYNTETLLFLLVCLMLLFCDRSQEESLAHVVPQLSEVKGKKYIYSEPCASCLKACFKFQLVANQLTTGWMFWRIWLMHSSLNVDRRLYTIFSQQELCALMSLKKFFFFFFYQLNPVIIT